MKKTIVGMILPVILLCIIDIASLGGFFTAASAGYKPTDNVVAIGLILVISLLLIVVILSLTYFYQKWYFAVYFYDLTPDFIQIKKGPITPREITLPYERIQDVYVDQDLFDRIFDLYDVHLSSATASSGMAAHIDGLEKNAADGLREVLLNTVKERISKYRGSTPPNNHPIS